MTRFAQLKAIYYNCNFSIWFNNNLTLAQWITEYKSNYIKNMQVKKKTSLKITQRENEQI